MRILFLSEPLTILLCFIIWPIIQTGCAFFCLYLPNRCFSPNYWIYKAHRFEREGQIYQTIFHVKKWKHLLPDGGVVWKKRGFKKKHLQHFDQETLERFLYESCRGEATHWLPILLFWVFFLFTPAYVGWIMLGYSLLVNVPCIIVQRYNRPRITRYLDVLMKRTS